MIAERMQLNVSDSPPDQWAGKIQRFDGNLFHSREWADTRRSECSRPIYFELRDSRARCCGIAVGIENRSPTPLIGRFSRLLEFETGPVVMEDRGEWVRTMTQQIIAHAKRTGYRSVAFQSYMTRTRIPQADSLGLKTDTRIEFTINLSLSDSRLLNGFNTHHKRKIKKALNNDLKLQEASDMAAMKQFRRLQIDSRDRRLQRGEAMPILQDAFYDTLGKKFFAANLGKVFMLSHQGQPVSTAFVAIYEGRALYMYGGSSDLGFAMDAPPLLFKYIFARCRELGCREFNLGGVPAAAKDPQDQSHGLFRFKAGFGGTQIVCENAYTDNLNPHRTKMVNLVKKLLRTS